MIIPSRAFLYVLKQLEKDLFPPYCGITSHQQTYRFQFLMYLQSNGNVHMLLYCGCIHRRKGL